MRNHSILPTSGQNYYEWTSPKFLDHICAHFIHQVVPKHEPKAHKTSLNWGRNKAYIAIVSLLLRCALGPRWPKMVAVIQESCKFE